MENDFFELYESCTGLLVEVGHNSVSDWGLVVYDRNGTTIKDSKPVIRISGCDRKKVFAKAYDELTDYLNESKGGY